jgi:hypothetical protein
LGLPSKIEHGKDAGDHEKRTAPFQKPTGIMENLERGAVQILRIPSGLGEFIGKTGDLGEESGREGGGMIHFELGGNFEILFRIGKGDGSAEVGRLIGAGITGDIKRV